MIPRKFTLTAIVLALVLPWTATAKANSTWQSNTFRSPTGNIICKLNIRTSVIACGSFTSQKVITLSPFARPREGWHITWDGSESWPILNYGWRYNQGKSVSCTSLYSGMKCQNVAGWYFKIDRDRVYVGRYGQAIYWL